MMTRFLCGIALGVFLPLAGARADEAAPPPVVADAPRKDAEGFEPVMPGEQLGIGEVLPATRLVAGAYGFILGALVVWVASVALRARRVEDELVALRAKIERQG